MLWGHILYLASSHTTEQIKNGIYHTLKSAEISSIYFVRNQSFQIFTIIYFSVLDLVAKVRFQRAKMLKTVGEILHHELCEQSLQSLKKKVLKSLRK